MDNEAKKCKVCGRLLTLDHYRKTAFAPNGVSACKECEGKKRSEIWAAKRAAIGGGQSATASDRTAKSNDKFAGITSREILEELQARGYKWNSLWLEKVKIEKQFVKL